jgi:hypothetical protein
MDSEQGLEINFTSVPAFPVRAESTWSLSKYYTDTRTVLGQFRVDIYLHGLGRIRSPNPSFGVLTRDQCDHRHTLV